MHVCLSLADFPICHTRNWPDEGHQQKPSCSKSRLQSIQLTGQYDENKLHINSKSYFELVQASAKVEQEQEQHEQQVELEHRIGLVLDYSLAVGAQEIIAKAC